MANPNRVQAPAVVPINKFPYMHFAPVETSLFVTPFCQEQVLSGETEEILLESE